MTNNFVFFVTAQKMSSPTTNNMKQSHESSSSAFQILWSIPKYVCWWVFMLTVVAVNSIATLLSIMIGTRNNEHSYLITATIFLSLLLAFQNMWTRGSVAAYAPIEVVSSFKCLRALTSNTGRSGLFAQIRHKSLTKRSSMLMIIILLDA